MATASGISAGTLVTISGIHSDEQLQAQIDSHMPIDKGASAMIYKAYLVPDGLTYPVALKVFPNLLHAAEQELIRRELKMLTKVSHSRVLPFIGTSDLGGRAIIVTPFMKNGNLLQYLKIEPGADRQNLLIQVAEAVSFLHDHVRVVHGDLKCENVLVSDDGNALVGDFGLSTTIDKDASSMPTITAIRNRYTLRFAAPELLLGPDEREISPGATASPRSKTRESDVYAFGMLVMQAFTEEPPWPHLREEAAMMKIITGTKPARPGDQITRLGFNDAWWAICCECWSLDYLLRPTMRHVCNTLTSLKIPRPSAQISQPILSFVSENPVLECFFRGNPNYIRELAEKAGRLTYDENTVLGSPDLLLKTVHVSLHQQVMYCDDSSSMRREGRWDAQAELVKRIAQVTTRILPEGDGVALRFINQDVDDSPALSLQQIGNIMQNTSWALDGGTEIGTYLRAKILQPMVYSKLDEKTIGRPLLVSVITDGMPSNEENSSIVQAIVECGDKLQAAGYPRESVRFMIGQVGTANGARKFLNGLRDNQQIADVAFVTSDQLDERFSALKENEADLDRWLIETLYSPFKSF